MAKYHLKLTAVRVLMYCTDMSCTLESIPEDLTAAGRNSGEYLEMAKKGGHKGNKGKLGIMKIGLRYCNTHLQ